jgi:hypothetical protein
VDQISRQIAEVAPKAEDRSRSRRACAIAEIAGKAEGR